MQHIWIIGAGKYGKKAVYAMKKRFPESIIKVVDESPVACNSIAQPNIETVCMDGVSFLFKNLDRSRYPVWVIPVIPVHLAFEWIRLKLSLSVEPAEIPVSVQESLPNVFPGKHGEIFISNASFLCPENCPEPEDICTYTKLPKKEPLYKLIESLSCMNHLNIVICSHQLAPGIGGITPQSLFNALDEIRNSKYPILLSTACGCHGVLQAFNLSPCKCRS